MYARDKKIIACNKSLIYHRNYGSRLRKERTCRERDASLIFCTFRARFWSNMSASSNNRLYHVPAILYAEYFMYHSAHNNSTVKLFMPYRNSHIFLHKIQFFREYTLPSFSYIFHSFLVTWNAREDIVQALMREFFLTNGFTWTTFNCLQNLFKSKLQKLIGSPSIEETPIVELLVGKLYLWMPIFLWSLEQNKILTTTSCMT